jgi:hypothetical protein
MQINLSTGDAILSLFIGALGSLLAAYVYSRAPSWLDTISIRWAERSRRSAKARIDRHTEELATITELKKNPYLLIGWYGSRLASMLSGVMMFVFMDGTINLILLKWRTSPVPGQPACLWELFGLQCSSSKAGQYAVVFMNGIELFILYVTFRLLTQCIQYSSLDTRSHQIESDIVRLRERLSGQKS